MPVLSQDPPPYKAGQEIVCQVVSKQPSGYSVVVCQDRSEGFLPTLADIALGTRISAQFVCVHRNRIMLASPFKPIT